MPWPSFDNRQISLVAAYLIWTSLFLQQKILFPFLTITPISNFIAHISFYNITCSSDCKWQVLKPTNQNHYCCLGNQGKSKYLVTHSCNIATHPIPKAGNEIIISHCVHYKNNIPKLQKTTCYNKTQNVKTEWPFSNLSISVVAWVSRLSFDQEELFVPNFKSLMYFCLQRAW